MNTENKIKKIIMMTLLSLIVVSMTLGNLPIVFAQDHTGTVNGDKTLDKTDIRCGEPIQVTLTLDGSFGEDDGASNIKVVDTINDHFTISDAYTSKGDADIIGNVVTWEIGELGTETATLTIDVWHDNTKSGGIEQVNYDVTYEDAQGRIVTFPNPSVNVRGCAAKMTLTPEQDTNELIPGATHTVTARVTDDFDDPLDHIIVDFVIAGPNIGKSDSDLTNINGEVPFTYNAEQGPSGLGTDIIEAIAPPQNRISGQLIATATKEWIRDRTPPECNCVETVNPAGKNIPPAGSTTLPGSKGGQNEDGFYKLTAKDNIDPNPQIWVVDKGSGTEFGPYASGTNIKYTQAKGAKPNEKKIGGPNSAVTVHITGKGDAAVYAIDNSGNKSPLFDCLVPPPPK